MDVAYLTMQEHIVRKNHMTKALPCMKNQQVAVKTTSKNQQTLRFQSAIFMTIFKLWAEKKLSENPCFCYTFLIVSK